MQGIVSLEIHLMIANIGNAKGNHWYFIQSKERIESKQSATVKKKNMPFLFLFFFNDENNRINIDTGIKKKQKLLYKKLSPRGCRVVKILQIFILWC